MYHFVSEERMGLTVLVRVNALKILILLIGDTECIQNTLKSRICTSPMVQLVTVIFAII